MNPGALTETLPALLPSDATNLAGQDTGRGHLSHSSISLQLNCLQKHAWKYHHRLEPVSRPAALSLGRAFQKAIEAGDPEAGVQAFNEKALVFSSEEMAQLRINEATIRAAATLYLEQFPPPETELREYEYRVRLRNPWTGRYSQTFDLLGYADGLDTGTPLTLVENKLVGQITALNVRRLPLDRQVALACYGIWRATGQVVRRVRYRWIRKPSIQRKKGRNGKGAESAEQFCQRLAADYRNRSEFYAHEEELFRSDDDLVRIEAELWEWAEQLRNARRRGFWPRNTSSCDDFGGCVYIPLCANDPDARSLYEVRARREDELPSQVTTTKEAA